MPRSALHSDGLTEAHDIGHDTVLGSRDYTPSQREMLREEHEAMARMRLLESRRRLGVRRTKHGRGSKLEDLMRGD